MMMDLDII